jgi:hypothetical protein
MELLKIMGIALVAMIFLAAMGAGGLALMNFVIVPIIGIGWTLAGMVVLLFAIICLKIKFEMNESNRYDKAVDKAIDKVLKGKKND